MIPSVSGYLEYDFEIEEQPTKVYKMELEGTSIRGFADGQEAMKQTVFRILNTERYAYIIYPWWYGIETLDLYGMPITWVCPELERRITEALLMDSRISAVTNFEHDISRKGVIHTSFTVRTIYGDLDVEREVNI